MATDFDLNKDELKDAQEAENDNREMVREADYFLNKRGGQWTPETISRMSGKPRYTFDQCNPLIDDIMGEMESMDFAIKVHPSGNEATNDDAKTYSGIIRGIENLSNARYIYKDAARIMTGTGLAGWRVVNDYRDSDSFDQDLLIQPITNFKDRVWFDTNAVKRTMEDAMKGWLMTSMTRDKYEKMFPNGSGLSVGEDRDSNVYTHKKSNEVLIGELLYKKPSKRKLALLSNGSVVEIDDDFDKVRDELFRRGIQVIRERERDAYTVYQRLFDGGDWLNDPQETVFEFIPIVPIYANWTISENKVVYWGAVEKWMDPQRVLNFAESRKIEEAALTPREKTWMTKDQAKSPDVRATLRTSNTNTDSHQLYDFEEGQPPPYRQPKQGANPILLEAAQTANQYMARSMPEENRGHSVPGRSGLAMGKLINKGDSANYKYFTATEIGIAHTCRILVKAAPKVYDTEREISTVAQDGTVSSITVNQKVVDQQTGDVVVLNNLKKGNYTVTCSAGPAFYNRQQEAVQGMIDIAGIAPDIVAAGSDLLVKNINAPDMDLLAERVRQQKVMNGEIPEGQLTDEEREMVDQIAQQGQQASPMDQLAIAEAQARLEETQANTADTLSLIQERQQKFELEAAKLAQRQQEAFMKFQEAANKAEQEERQQIIDILQGQADQLKTQAETLKILKDAMGVDTIVGPTNTQAYTQQAGVVVETQQQTGTTPQVGL